MRTYILSLFMLLMMPSGVTSATIYGNGLPGAVNTSMEEKYRGAKILDWRYEDNVCLVNFQQGGRNYEAVFDRDGNWIRTGRVIKMKHLPGPVEPAFKDTEYFRWDVEQISEVQFRGFEDVNLYEIKVSNGDDGYSLFYDEQANLVMKTYNRQLRVAMN